MAMNTNSSSTGGGAWTSFDAVKSFPPTPEELMEDIDSAISALEYARANALLSPSTSRTAATATHDARLTEEAYRSACAELSAGRPDAALRSLRLALSSCPPDKKTALSKLRALLSLASQQQQIQIQQKRG
ncbi:hypothetical protein QJS04_geneDACA021723 [Acorus gramineus]|uniref:Tetratricopeptide repeat protein 36 n=1 Tax=Acorus gramineus TaxID=55184 RepID=A0AAV9AJH1_ACOGR|nr:hypothetical protein QJS04_geneDACA021723 [Acorus gramineus]